jgi:hypothetical protein
LWSKRLCKNFKAFDLAKGNARTEIKTGQTERKTMVIFNTSSPFCQGIKIPEQFLSSLLWVK